MSRVIGAGQFEIKAQEFEPAYMKLYRTGELHRRAEEALRRLESCMVCPRNCKVNRLEEKTAVCKTGRYALVSSAFPHFGEEDCLRGWSGSGTIFFSMCNLRCVFCIGPDGHILTDRGIQRIEDIFLSSGQEITLNGGKIRFPQGLLVYTRKGRLAPVAKAFCHPYRGEMVVIKPYGLPSLVVTPNHPVFAALRPESEVQKVPAKALTRAHLLVVPKCRREAWEGIPPGRGVRYRETPEAFLVPIRRISRIRYEGPVYNLEVADGDHSYIADGLGVGNCQNYDISQAGEGREVKPERLARMMIELQDRRCHNINFVTPEHVVPQILEAIPMAVEMGLRLPFVYNTSAYDSLDSLSLMDGIVDIYMPDFKFWDPEMAKKYVKAKDYPEAARAAIKEMYRQVGDLVFDENGLAKRGLLVRHLIMPGGIAGTREIMRFLAQEVSIHTYVNIMDQYYPAGVVSGEKYAEINRHITREEYQEAVRIAREEGLYRFDTRRPLIRRPWWS